MTFCDDTRPHPLGILDNREWEEARARRADLYLAERKRREEPDHEPSNAKWTVIILAVVGVAVALIGAWA